ncbi:hypothetical protein ACFVUY_19390 [Kitasatospora sp. NPDC058063]|uniref:hypothetical protein n=1 Tax=unclassified Kitasatospora TaxID=2633591 RepID=UPI0036DEEEAB
MNVDPTEKNPAMIRAALVALCETELDLEPTDLALIDIAAPMLARDAIAARWGNRV